MTRKFIKLESLLSGGDPKMLSGAEPQANPELVAAGWVCRFTVDSQRIKEVVELYSRLGYDVHVEPFRTEEMHSDCTDCASQMVSEFKTIYTRRRRS